MSEEILANVSAEETRVALVEDGVLQEVLIERAGARGIVGNIYTGRVQRVLPGMQSAFVDIGLERSGFLHVGDMVESRQEDEVGTVGDNGESGSERNRARIETLLREGQDVLVQVRKDALGTKGARLTTRITLPSRYLVLMPGLRRLGISTRIADEAERERLQAMADELRCEGLDAGFIVRTAGEGASSESLLGDMRFLCKLWGSILERARQAAPGTLIHGDLPLVMRILRDLLDTRVERVRIDSRESWQQVQDFVERFIPQTPARIEHYDDNRPIFDLYGVEDEIQRALQRRVDLKSGGYLVIDQTESMTTIDVNTGGFVGHRNFDETICKTNLEAARVIARQLRLRNLGGIIIVDFIDMEHDEHRRQVLRVLRQAVEKDLARVSVGELSPLGLVEMTRKRTRESLEQVLCEPCPTCSGRGFVKTAQTVCLEIQREIQREARQSEAEGFLVLASPGVIERLLDEDAATLAGLEATLGRPVRLQAQDMYDNEQFDVVVV